MTDSDLPDFTEAFSKVFLLADTIRKLRGGFQFSKDDAAERDREFIEKWRRIREENGVRPTE